MHADFAIQVLLPKKANFQNSNLKLDQQQGRGARVAEGGDLVLDGANARKAVGAVPGRALHLQRAVGIVPHVVFVHAPHRGDHVVAENLRAGVPFPCMHARPRVITDQGNLRSSEAAGKAPWKHPHSVFKAWVQSGAR